MGGGGGGGWGGGWGGDLCLSHVTIEYSEDNFCVNHSGRISHKSVHRIKYFSFITFYKFVATQQLPYIASH